MIALATAKRRWAKAGLAWSDWVKTKSDIRAAREGCIVAPVLGEHVIQFFANHLRHSKGRWAGERFTLLKWERDMLMPLFSWVRPDGTRRFRRGGVWIAKKNGKSTLCAGLVMYLLIADDEPGAEIYGAAVDRHQAAIVFNEAASMVAKSPDMAERLYVNKTVKRIAYPDRGCFYQALSKEAGTAEGVNAHAVIEDELHAWKNRELYDALRYSGAARRQPLELTISTAGVYDPESIGYEQYDYARMVRDGAVIDTSFFPLIFEVAADADWTDERQWAKANPSMGETIDIDEMRTEFKAAEKSIVAQNRFRRYRLNQWVQQEVRWIDLGKWNRCQRDFTPDDLLGRSCWAGLDLASRKDTTAFVLCFPPPDEDEDELFYVLPFFWVPRDSLELRTHEEKRLFQAWAESGDMFVTHGAETDYSAMRDVILDCAKRYDLRGVAYDNYNATSDTIGPLGDAGINMVEHQQGMVAMTAPTKRFETLILGRNLAHAGHPCLTYQINNVEVKIDSNENMKPVRTGRRRIDGVVAAIMALNLCMTQETPEPSVYEERGLLWV